MSTVVQGWVCTGRCPMPDKTARAQSESDGLDFDMPAVSVPELHLKCLLWVTCFSLLIRGAVNSVRASTTHRRQSRPTELVDLQQQDHMGRQRWRPQVAGRRLPCTAAGLGSQTFCLAENGLENGTLTSGAD